MGNTVEQKTAEELTKARGVPVRKFDEKTIAAAVAERADAVEKIVERLEKAQVVTDETMELEFLW